MDKSKIVYVGHYDKKNFKFMLNSESQVSFEDLYNNTPEKNKDTNNNELITENKIVYVYNTPHTKHFTFPDGTKKEIFIANMRQFIHINKDIMQGTEYKIIISDNGKNYTKSDDINKSYASKFIKYDISSINKEDFSFATSYRKSNDPLSLKDLSLSYDYYLENTNLVNDKNNFFFNTDKRKEFFYFLNTKLNDNKYYW